MTREGLGALGPAERTARKGPVRIRDETRHLIDVNRVYANAQDHTPAYSMLRAANSA